MSRLTAPGYRRACCGLAALVAAGADRGSLALRRPARPRAAAERGNRPGTGWSTSDFSIGRPYPAPFVTRPRSRKGSDPPGLAVGSPASPSVSPRSRSSFQRRSIAFISAAMFRAFFRCKGPVPSASRSYRPRICGIGNWKRCCRTRAIARVSPNPCLS